MTSVDLAWHLLRRGLALADVDVAAGRTELRDALSRFTAADPAEAIGRLLAGAALVQCIGIADDDYTGFEDAVAAVVDGTPALDTIDDPGDRLLARAGALVAGWFRALDDPMLPALADAIVRTLADARIAAPVRARAGLAALGYHQARLSLENVLWIELAMRSLLVDPGIGARLADEWHHALVQGFWECGARERAEALRAERSLASGELRPEIALKLLLLDAQVALGEGRLEAGLAALTQSIPLLDVRAPRAAGWWHLLRSRLHLTQGQHRDALTHARLSLRLAQESNIPERWMGVTVMQEGQIQLAMGAPAEAVPFFDRAGAASSGAQADFCWCLAHFARALAAIDAGRIDAGREALGLGFGLARQLHWQTFLRALPNVAASLCALALEHGIEEAFVREVIAARGLEAVRRDLAAWPWPIRIATLGAFRIELNGVQLAFRGKVAKKPLELLQFVIASSGSDVSIDTATFALWPDLDGDKARAALTIALHRLRKLLGHDDAVLLEFGRLGLNGRLMWVDCLAFEQLVDSTGGPAAVPSPAAIGAAQRAVELYRGAFLPTSQDHVWQMICRTRLASKFKRMVALLVGHAVAGGQPRAARTLLERALELDPLAEETARELMRILIELGEHAAAIAVFERCRAAIFDGLGARPSAATLALLAPLRGAGAANDAGPGAPAIARSPRDR